jgi:hypothetical protein
MEMRVLTGWVIKLKKSALIAVLIYFSLTFELRGAMPLTETIYTIPMGRIEIISCVDFVKINTEYRRETISLGMGILHDISIWYSFQYLHKGTIKTDADELGDSFFNVWYYIGDYLNGSFHAGFLFKFRIPTGPDAYADGKWRNLSFGNNELKIGPVFQIDILKNIFFHVNTFYIFRQGINEGFYSGFSADLFDKKTYADLFGFNFQSEDSFMAGGRLKNDYISVSFAINTVFLYPLIIYTEIYKSQKVYNKKSGQYNLQIEGAGINPLLLSAGGRYFFRESLFLGLYYIINPDREENYINDIFGFDCSLEF